MTDYNVRIKVAADGAKQAANEIEGIGAQAKSTSAAVELMKSALVGLAAAFSIGKLVEYADAYATLQSRLRGVSKDAADYAVVQSRLTSIANDSRSGIEETANLYAKLKIGTQGLSFSTDDLLKVTGSLNKTFALSGASAEQTKNALIQLNQGLGAGALRGEEFNSVQEATQGEFGRIIEKAGLVSGSIRQLADNGQLTADLIIKSFQKMGAEIDTRFSQVPLTVGQAFTVLQNAVFNFFGAANQASGATSLLANGIVFLANNLQTIVGVMASAGAAFVTFNVATTASSVAIGGLRGALVALQAVLAINPFVLIATAIAGIVTALYTITPNMSLFGSTTMTVGDAINSTFAIMRDVLGIIGQLVVSVAGYFADKWGQAVDLVNRGTTALSGFFSALFQNADGTRTFLGAMVDGLKLALAWVEKLFGRLVDWLKSLDILKPLIKDIENFGKATQTAAGSAQDYGSSVKGLNGNLGGLSDASKRAADDQNRLSRSLNEPTFAMRLQADAVAAMIERYNALGQAANDSADSVAAAARRQAEAQREAAQRQANEALKNAAGSARGGSNFTPFTFQGQTFGPINASISSGGGAAGLDVSQYATQLDFFKAAGATTGFGNSALGQAQNTLYQVLKDIAYFNAPKRGGGYRDPNEALANAQQGIARAKAMLGGYDAATVKSALGSLSSLVGFRSGGSFTVGGQDGVDRNLVMFRATKGERVNVETKSQQRPTTAPPASDRPVVINIATPDADSFRRSQQQTLTDFARQVNRAIANA